MKSQIQSQFNQASQGVVLLNELWEPPEQVEGFQGSLSATLPIERMVLYGAKSRRLTNLVAPP